MNKIKYFRIVQGLQLKDLAMAAKVTIGHVSHLENGTREPSKAAMEAIAAALSKTVPEVFYTPMTVAETDYLAARGFSFRCNNGQVQEIVEEGGVKCANSI